MQSAKVWAMKTQDAIHHLGTAAALAKLVGVTPGAVSQWGEFPPDNRQLQIERLTGQALVAEPGCLDRLIGMPQIAEA